MIEYSKNGIMYTWNLAGPNGAAFKLFPTDYNTLKDVQDARKQIRNERDAVCISVASPEDWDDLYRSDIFRVPSTKPLKWYQINADDMRLIRKCRLSGMSAEEYVNTYVLPMIDITEANNRAKHGNDLY